MTEVSEKTIAVIFADGGSRGNPGPSGCGAVIKAGSEKGEILANLSKFVGITTNNVAEYTGLLIGLEKALAMGFSEVEVRMDSELIVKQIKGIYRCKNEGLMRMATAILLFKSEIHETIKICALLLLIVIGFVASFFYPNNELNSINTLLNTAHY